jgi:hypothetical protein
MKSEKFFGYWRDASEVPPRRGYYLTWIEYLESSVIKGQYYIVYYNERWGLNSAWRCKRW